MDNVVATTTPTVVVQNDLFGSELTGTFPGDGNVFSDDPLLGPLQDNGGLTQTRAPLSGSPAIDAGSDKFAVDASGHLLTHDQTLNPRFFGTVDIGAVENQGDRIFADGFD